MYRKSSLASAGHFVARLAALCCLAIAAPGFASVFTVTRTDDQLDASPGDGACVALNGGGCSLRAAVQEANAHGGSDSIYLPAGTYVLDRAGADEELAAAGDLDVSSQILLVGEGWQVTTIHMAGAYDRVFDVQGFANLDLEDLTVEGGFVLAAGGGVRVQTGGIFSLRRSRVRLCSATEGGAIGVTGGAATVEDSELSDNFTSAGQSGWSGRGPALAGASATLTVRRSSIHDNHRDGDFAGIDVLDSTLAVESSTVYDDGYPYYSVVGQGSDVSIVSSTIRTLFVSPALYDPEVGSLTLGCSYFYDCGLSVATYIDYGLNIFNSDSSECLASNDGIEPIYLSRLMAPAGKFPARVPLRYSGAIDGGNGFVCLPWDQWGQPRPADGDGDHLAVVDIGAVEAILIFADGFDRDGWNPWSGATP